MGGATVMVLFLALTRRDLLKIKLRHIWYFIGTGIISLALFNLCYFTVIELSQASIAVVLLYTSPIFVTLLFRTAVPGASDPAEALRRWR